MSSRATEEGPDNVVSVSERAFQIEEHLSWALKDGEEFTKWRWLADE